MALALVLIVLVLGSLLFHFLSPWWFTPLASNWGNIDDTVMVTFWVTGTVFVAVNLFLAYVVIKYRHKKGTLAHYEPENKKLEWWLSGFTTVGVVAMLAPGLFVWAEFIDPPKDASEVEAVGQQWSWTFRFPGSDGVFGSTDTRYMTVSNPFGMNPEDPRGKDDILISSSELHLPVGKPVKLLLRSKDVLHDFAVPQFRVKMDLVPGMVTSLWLTPTRTGRFDVLCEELCGLAHYAMRGHVVVQEQNEFEAWLAHYPTYAEASAVPAGDPAAGKVLYAVCAACHGQQGEGNQALHAPRLAGQAEWYLERQLRAFRNGARGVHEADEYGRQMAQIASMLEDDAAVRNVVAFIGTFPELRVKPTVAGEEQRGGRLYASCVACHGAGGQGIWSQNAPRLAGINDWYLSRQINNFKRGLRGGAASDGHGRQMALIAGMLKDDQSIRDVVAYINTL